MNLLHTWLETPAATALGWTLVHSLWQGALVALALAAALRLVQSAPARYAAGCAALVVLAAAFAVTFARELPEGPAHPVLRLAAGAQVPLPLADAAPPSIVPSPDRTVYLRWLAALWMAGVLAFQIRGVAAWMGARRLRGTGVCAAPGPWRARLDRLAQRARIARPVMLLESCLADVPVVIGYLRPAILLPVGLLAGLPADQVEAILLHELAHIRRHDYLVNLLQMFVEGLLFYHPAVWWISAAIRAERENCCDDVVVATQGDAYAYASALTALEERRTVAGDAVLASTGGNLVKRIRRLLAPAEGPRAGLTPVFSAVILTVTLVGAMAAWQARPAVAAPPPPPPQAASAAPAAPLPQAAPVRMAQALPVRKQGPAPQAEPDATQPTPYGKWLHEDVAYIITDAERATFKGLQTDSEREHFIEQFWVVRDPTPGTVENEFKEEHYRRIAYANTRFSPQSGLPGWKTDRGRIYITFGPPDEIDSHPNGNATSTVPFELWRYRFIEGVGQNVIVEFVDPTMTGEFRMTMDPAEKEKLVKMSTAPDWPVPAQLAGGRGGVRAMDPLNATVQPVGANGVQLSVPLDRYGDHKVNLYVRILTEGHTLVSPWEDTVQDQLAYTRFLALKPGTYRLSVVAKDLTTGAVATTDIGFSVK